MKSIYAYTMKKYLKSYSTWVILLLSAVGIGFVIGGYLPFAFVNVSKTNAPMVYIKSIMAAIAGVSVFFGIFSAIFAGFKSSSMYKDEVENGTFLVLLSKPLRRGQIVFGKWLALQTLLVGYGLISVIFLCVGIVIFDNGDQISGLKSMGVSSLKSHIWFVGIFIFLILYITSLFFSSIGLILSIRLSTGATIGITIALGIYIPLSGLLSIFMRKPEAIPISKTDAYTQMFAEHFESAIDSNPALKLLFPDMDKEVKELVSTAKASDLYGKAVLSGEKDSFKNTWWLDVDYQFRLLAGFAYEKVIPSKILNSVSDHALGGIFDLPKDVNVGEKVDSKEFFDGIKIFLEKYKPVGTDAAKALTWKHLLDLQPATLTDFENYMKSLNDPLAIFKSGTDVLSLIGKLAPSSDEPLDFEKIQQWLTSNKDSFVDVKATLTDFVKFVLAEDEAVRDKKNFMISDDYLIKIPLQNLVNVHVKTKQNYNYLRESTNSLSAPDFEKEYTQDVDYPDEFYNNLEKWGDSKPLINFLRNAEKEYHDPKYKASSDSLRYIDFKLYKEWLALEFTEDAPEGSKDRFYATNLSSNYIQEDRLTQNGATIYDENYMRTSFYLQQHFWEYLKYSFLNISEGKSDMRNVNRGNAITPSNVVKGLNMTKTYISSIYDLLEPLSSMLFQTNGGGEMELGDTEIELHDVNVLRKTIEGDEYDFVKRHNKKYLNDLEDPITNLSTRGRHLVKEALSVAVNNQLVNAEVKPYANKTTLLIVYAALALALVPVAHWLVRRQDFR